MIESEQMVCGGCGTRNLADSVFCEECGVAIKKEELRDRPFPMYELHQPFRRGKHKKRLRKSSPEAIRARIDARVKVIKREIKERKTLELSKRKRSNKKIRKAVNSLIERLEGDYPWLIEGFYTGASDDIRLHHGDGGLDGAIIEKHEGEVIFQPSERLVATPKNMSLDDSEINKARRKIANFYGVKDVEAYLRSGGKVEMDDNGDFVMRGL